MTTVLQDLEIRSGEVRRRLRAIGAMESMTDDTRSEADALGSECDDIERRMAAMKRSGDEPTVTTLETRSEDSESRELRELLVRANIGDMYMCVLEKRSAPEGAMSELQQHYGLAINQLPIEMLETRAAATVTGDVQGNQQSVVPQVFPRSISDYFGISRPVVPVGQAIWPVLSTGATVHTPAKGGSAAESTAAFVASTLSPRRLQGALRYTREDAAMFQSLDSSLRDNLSDALASKLDDFNINDSVDGLLGTNGLTDPTNPTAEAAFSDYISLIWDNVDGYHANSAAEVRTLMSVKAYAHAGTSYRGASSDVPAIEHMMRVGGGVRSTPHIAADANNDETVLVRKGMLEDFVSPVWRAISIIMDEYTASSDGEIILTAVMLANHKMLRAAGFSRNELQTA